MIDKIKVLMWEIRTELALFGGLLLLAVILGIANYDRDDVKFIGNYNTMFSTCMSETPDVDVSVYFDRKDSVIRIYENTLKFRFDFRIDNRTYEKSTERMRKNGYIISQGFSEQVAFNPKDSTVLIKLLNGCVYGFTNERSVRHDGGPIRERDVRPKAKKRSNNSEIKIQRAGYTLFESI